MKTVKLTKVTTTELSVLQEQIGFYQADIQTNIRISDIDKFLDSIIELDISLRLWFIMRSRLEKDSPAKGFTINLKPSEAAILFKICRMEDRFFSDYWLNVIRKYRAEIDRQLKSMV
ncbi:hypothetical protein [Flavobacterium lindanitolerans]|uniref:hypothetical protein n=1 Tax=Flavobacterium lindanitolerans TaxID=428988 RepID=UPI0023F2468F|nr:hypothetical protein [Flavobacterium lindanitolerans]